MKGTEQRYERATDGECASPTRLQLKAINSVRCYVNQWWTIGGQVSDESSCDCSGYQPGMTVTKSEKDIAVQRRAADYRDTVWQSWAMAHPALDVPDDKS